MASDRFSRRHFFYGSLLAGAVPTGGFGSVPSLPHMGYKSPSEKLNIASIGAGGKAASDINGCSTENIVALCDVDEVKAAAMFKRFESVPKYKDFRVMLDKEAKNIDAVIVTVPDHMHGTAAMACMERNKHVYVQKPLTRTIWEARMLRDAAAKYKVATQMGNQGYAQEGTRLCSEMIWSGVIGNVTEVHAWTNRPIWAQGFDSVGEAKVPETLDWDSWLGISSMRPYTPEYLPFKWRGFYDFGCGALGDMACHVLGAPNMALLLGAPTSVECVKQTKKNALTFPESSVLRFDFPARGSMPPVKLFWYDGVSGAPYRPDTISKEERLGDGGGTGAGARAAANASAPVPPPAKPARADNTGMIARAGGSGSLFVGEKGFLTAGEYGGSPRLIPEEQMRDYKLPPPFLNRTPGTYRDWIRACKGGDPACSNFNISAPFTEWILLGVIALHFEGKLDWDSAKMRFTNNNEANQYLKPKMRAQYKSIWKA